MFHERESDSEHGQILPDPSLPGPELGLSRPHFDLLRTQILPDPRLSGQDQSGKGRERDHDRRRHADLLDLQRRTPSVNRNLIVTPRRTETPLPGVLDSGPPGASQAGAEPGVRRPPSRRSSTGGNRPRKPSGRRRRRGRAYDRLAPVRFDTRDAVATKSRKVGPAGREQGPPRRPGVPVSRRHAGSPRDLGDSACDPVGRLLHRIVGQVRIARRRLHLAVAQKLPDHRQTLPDQQTAAGEGVA